MLHELTAILKIAAGFLSPSTCPFITCLRVCTDPLLRDYWVYEGSLTIPPCSEGVTWILFRYPLTISQMQVSMHLSILQREVMRLNILSIKGKRSSSCCQIISFRMKVKCCEPGKLIERSKVNESQCSFMICILKVSVCGGNKSHCETGKLEVSLAVTLCEFFQVWERKVLQLPWDC